MPLELVTDYATDGAPLFVSDQATASRWRGSDDDGSGAVVEYMALRHADLPPAFVQTRRPGMQRKKLPSLEAARAFAAELLPVLQTLHPGAAPPERFPGHPGHYLHERRVFSIEVKFTSMFDSVVSRLGGDVACVAFEKGRKARALFVQQAGGGRGLIACDVAARRVLVARVSAGSDVRAAFRALVTVPVPKTRLKAKLQLAHSLLVAFDSARAWREIAEHNPVPAARGVAGALRMPGQRAPGGAYVRLPAASYSIAYRPLVDLGGAAASLVWLTPPP